MAEYEQMTTTLARRAGALAVTGCADSAKANLIYAFGEDKKMKLIVTYSDMRAQELYEDYSLYDRNTYVFPAKDMIFFEADINGNQIERQRLKCIRRLIERRAMTMITTWSALMLPCIDPEVIADSVININRGEELNLKKISSKLVRLGYGKTDMVENPGEFAIHGGILDIFDLTEDNPYRIELWGDEIDSIRSFDVDSQRSILKLEGVRIYPATELILDEDELHKGFDRIEADCKAYYEKLRTQFKTEEAARIKKRIAELKEQLFELGLSRGSVNLESYIGYFYDDLKAIISFFDKDRSMIFIDEPGHTAEHAKATEDEFTQSMSHRLENGYILPGQANLIISAEKTAASLEDRYVVLLGTLTCVNPYIPFDRVYDAGSRSIAPYNNSFDALVKDLQKYKKSKSRVVLLSGSRTRAKRLAQDLSAENLSAFYTEDPARLVQPGEVECFYGHLRGGFEYPEQKFAVISESDIFGSEKKSKPKKRKHYEGAGAIKSFGDLKVGDYVVHESHGLGIYQGIEQVSVEGVVKDYIKISYRDGGNLYVPATGLDVIQKYASADAKVPKLNKLGTKEWEKTTTRVRESVDEIADDLVQLYAARQSSDGYKYGPDTVWQREFEELFPYEETQDQLAAIEATKADMESTKIMDRLICGDVGFGKTEIAIRAAFKAVQEGKQVVYLVPTTILAQQHYNTFTARMKDFPVTIELMSRFRSASEQKKVIEGLKKGMVDIVIGTHRVLSKDMAYKDLGLLIIDEEQRFGVAHKEAIKKLRTTVDVLTLTATPIPRTMHMALVGIRDMSILEEAPEERRPIQTFVCEFNEEMVREAIIREISRGGQVYYVYNVVNNIADVTAFLSELVPEARIGFAHGQMQEQELERIMYDFVNGDIDVLVSTTIIETGMDIPNVNTMIIHESDKLGLAQLYQLRGRVGRSNRTSYAFLMYKRDKMLKEVAEKRLNAIREFTDLGSGYRIAMRDLEIRGAGNLLGAKQSGNMQSVGYDMYCKLLTEAVKKKKGIKTMPDYETEIDLDVDAYIPDYYIMNEIQKLDIYKRITAIETAAEKQDMQDELIDRFGEVPKCADNLLRIAILKAAAHKLGIESVKGRVSTNSGTSANDCLNGSSSVSLTCGEIMITMRTDAPIEVANIPAVLAACGRKLSFGAKGTPVFKYRFDKTGLVEKDEELLLSTAEWLIEEAFAPLAAAEEAAD